MSTKRAELQRRYGEVSVVEKLAGVILTLRTINTGFGRQDSELTNWSKYNIVKFYLSKDPDNPQLPSWTASLPYYSHIPPSNRLLVTIAATGIIIVLLQAGDVKVRWPYKNKTKIEKRPQNDASRSLRHV